MLSLFSDIDSSLFPESMMQKKQTHTKVQDILDSKSSFQTNIHHSKAADRS